MKTLLIATHNRAKLKELKSGVKSFLKQEIKILSLNDINVKASLDESGKTFEENSRLKAKFYGDLTSLPTIADDGGLIIPALNNEPGVKSRRWLGYEATDEELIDYTLKRLKGFPRKKRIAYLETCLCFYLPSFTPYVKQKKSYTSEVKLKNFLRNTSEVMPEIHPRGETHKHHLGGETLYEQEKIKGYIAETAIKNYSAGYPFRALFIVERFGKYYDELTEEEHEKENHRLRALKRLVKRIEKYLIEYLST